MVRLRRLRRTGFLRAVRLRRLRLVVVRLARLRGLRLLAVPLRRRFRHAFFAAADRFLDLAIFFLLCELAFRRVPDFLRAEVVLFFLRQIFAASVTPCFFTSA